MHGRKDPSDEGVYMAGGKLGEPSGRVAATRAQLEAARREERRTIRDSEWDTPVVDVAKAWVALMADDERLGRR